MSEERESPTSPSEVVSAKLIGYYFTLLVILAPAFVHLSWFPASYPSVSFWGMIGQIWYNPEPGVWVLDYYWVIFNFIHSIPYIFLRPVFAYQMVRYYQGKSSRKQTLLVGLFIELQTLIIDVPKILILDQAFYFIDFPIPLLLIGAVIVMKYRLPTSSIKSWVEEEKENKEWWGSEGQKSAKPRYLKSFTLNKALKTVLIAELILLIFGGAIVALGNSWYYRAFYAHVIPFLILITGAPYLMTRPTKE